MVKFSEEIVQKLCEEREKGISIKDCANLCGIDRKTLHRWIDKGKEAKSGRYREFYERFEKANSDFKKSLVEDIKKDKTWQSSAWLLERTFPEEYGKREKIDMNADINNKTDLSVYFDEKKMREILDESRRNESDNE